MCAVNLSVNVTGGMGTGLSVVFGVIPSSGGWYVKATLGQNEKARELYPQWVCGLAC